MGLQTSPMNTQFYQNSSTEIFKSSLPVAPDHSFAAEHSRRANNQKAALLDQKIERYARTNHHVLLTGERGTGKTTIARRIHDQSVRRAKQFVSLNCATLQAELVEAELFGYEKGAFTGATNAKAGLFETGAGGTVFLDEVGELSLSLQAKLLKAVEEKRIRRVGASKEIPIDLRVIAATSRNLRQMTERGEFRADLYDRLNVLNLETIPLREQKEKIRDLVVAGLERERVALGRKANYEIEQSAFALLEKYSWTGNFRELQNFVLKLAIEFVEAEIITKADVSAMLAERGASFADEQANDESFAAPSISVADNSNHLIFAINPEENLNSIIERVKESYIRHHLKSKSLRAIERESGLSRKMMRRFADLPATSNQIQQL